MMMMMRTWIKSEILTNNMLIRFCVCRDSLRSDKSGIMPEYCSSRSGKTRRKPNPLKSHSIECASQMFFCIRWSSCHCFGPNLYVYVVFVAVFFRCGYNKPRNTYKFLSHFIARRVTLINSLFVMKNFLWVFVWVSRGCCCFSRSQEKPLQTKDAYFFLFFYFCKCWQFSCYNGFGLARANTHTNGSRIANGGNNNEFCLISIVRK